MSARMTIDGLPELLAALRNLPQDLLDEGTGIVDDQGQAAEAEIKANYDAHAFTGKLSRSVVREEQPAGRWGHAVVIRAKAKHAGLFERGTAARHTSQGSYRGVMPPAPPMHRFIPVMERKRRAMFANLRRLLEAHGLLVTQDDAR